MPSPGQMQQRALQGAVTDTLKCRAGAGVSEDPESTRLPRAEIQAMAGMGWGADPLRVPGMWPAPAPWYSRGRGRAWQGVTRHPSASVLWPPVWGFPSDLGFAVSVGYGPPRLSSPPYRGDSAGRGLCPTLPLPTRGHI